jgi:hypothetical protein
VIRNIAPDIPLSGVVWGGMPFVVLLTISIVLLCLFPAIATWFADAIMGGGAEIDNSPLPGRRAGKFQGFTIAR